MSRRQSRQQQQQVLPSVGKQPIHVHPSERLPPTALVASPVMLRFHSDDAICFSVCESGYSLAVILFCGALWIGGGSVGRGVCDRE